MDKAQAEMLLKFILELLYAKEQKPSKATSVVAEENETKKMRRKPGKHLTHEQRKSLVDDARKGIRVSELAKKYGIAKTSVYPYIKYANASK